LDDLKVVYDADREKDADEYVPLLAKLFEARRTSTRASQARFQADLRAVYESEKDEDPEDHLPLLAARLNEWRSHRLARIKEYLSKLPEDDPLRCPIGLFGTLGLGRVETAHTNALAWLLHPAHGHGLDTCLIQALLDHLAAPKSYAKVTVQTMEKEYPLVLSGKELGRIDVYGTGSWTTSTGVQANWLLAIEAKIDAGEGDKQLQRYDEWINAHRGNREVFRVFLTPDGRPPEADIPHWTRLSFHQLACVFRKPYLQLRDRPGFHFLRFYLTGVLRDICGWNIPAGNPESCDDPSIVAYLKVICSFSQGEPTCDRIG
jgi:hypothetical protein